MYEDMKTMEHGVTDTFASLYPVVKNLSPDEAFSMVPFEKGYQFLVYLE